MTREKNSVRITSLECLRAPESVFSDDKENKKLIEAELEDTLDEMFEEEFNAPALTEEMRKVYRDKHPNMLDKNDLLS